MLDTRRETIWSHTRILQNKIKSKGEMGEGLMVMGIPEKHNLKGNNKGRSTSKGK